MTQETRNNFNLVVGFVDDTYWDDGSRFTSRKIPASSQEEMLKKLEEIKLNPQMSFESNVTRTRSLFRIHWARTEEVETKYEIHDIP